MLFAHGTHAPPTTAPRSSRRGECAMDDAVAINWKHSADDMHASCRCNLKRAYQAESDEKCTWMAMSCDEIKHYSL